MNETIVFRNVTRRYGQVQAMNDVSLEIGPGITGLVGPNGAGKTTFIRLLTGLHKPTGGQVLLQGRDPFRDTEARRGLGFCPDTERAWDWMTGREFVATLARYSEVPEAELDSRITAILARLELTQAGDKPISQYSRGMRQKIKLAQAVIHNPQVLVLDEPLNGVDPVSRHLILKLLRELADQGRTVLISSHVLHELDGLIHEVVLLQRGRVLASGSVDSIRDLLDEHPHTLRIRVDKPRTLAGLLVDVDGVVTLDMKDGEHLEVRTRNPSELYSRLPSMVVESGLLVSRVHALDSNLEAVFNYLVKGGAG